MRFAIIFAIVAIVWFVIGEIATRLNGYILRKKLSRMMGITIEETENIVENEVEQKGGDTDISNYDLWCNSLTWPYSIYRAVIGYRCMKKSIRMGNIALNRGGESYDCKRNQRQSSQYRKTDLE